MPSSSLTRNLQAANKTDQAGIKANFSLLAQQPSRMSNQQAVRSNQPNPAV